VAPEFVWGDLTPGRCNVAAELAVDVFNGAVGDGQTISHAKILARNAFVRRVSTESDEQLSGVAQALSNCVDAGANESHLLQLISSFYPD